MRFYVYELVEVSTGIVFYVGKGSGGRLEVYKRSYQKRRDKVLADLQAKRDAARVAAAE